MKTLLTGVFAVILAWTCAACATAAAPRAHGSPPPHLRSENGAVPGVIEVTLRGIGPVEGQLFVELYDESTYFRYDEVLNERIVPVTGSTMVVTLEHVPPGRYIVVGSQDINGNNALDTGLFGIPKEPYGFSRDARGTFGPPSFADGAIDFDGTRLSVEVALR
jgi:uncharacterized protein (DUF2141 family)